ncbi:MAG: gamma-glutamyl-gamma-aminobutyrate hydrolase family protein [Bacteroidales bacterium]
MRNSNLSTRNNRTLLLLFLLGIFALNNLHSQPAPLKVALSKASPNYVNWLKRADPSVETIDLYALPISAALQQLNLCSALVLTGGEDVWPGRYGKAYDTLRCTDMNPHRDSLDMALIKKALELKMPIVGICRGHQILNVYLGGSLIIDIPKDFTTTIRHQCDDYLHCFHAVSVKKNTILSSVSMCEAEQVTTNHHQGVDRLASSLIANAISDDHLIEGIEWKNPDEKSFLLGVQWHPERMDRSNPLSSRIAEEFLLQATSYSYKRH